MISSGFRRASSFWEALQKADFVLRDFLKSPVTTAFRSPVDAPSEQFGDFSHERRLNVR
jgi:hypothetical protein